MGERRRVVIDPAVAAVLGDGRKRERFRRMNKVQRRQARRDATRKRVTYELDPRVVEMTASIAGVEGCSPAGVVNLLMVEGIRRYVDGEVEFYENVRESRCPRWLWVVVPEGIEEVVRRLGEKLARGGPRACSSTGVELPE